jgi:hypothetical protein
LQFHGVHGVMKALSILAALAIFSAGTASNVCAADVADAAGKVDINTADIPTLEAVPEIGTNFANAVVANRPFKSVYELQPILKISAEKMVALHAKVTASPPKIPSPIANEPSPSTTTPVAGKASAEPAPTPTLASKQERTDAKLRHVRRDPLSLAEPPPPARAETKPASPGTNYVWKPGHWSPVQSEWKWTPGEWSVPPTPISVWIEGTYDAKEQRWSPGYWEPDVLRTPEQ